MRKTVAAIAFALLWAPTEGFIGQSSATGSVSSVSTGLSATALSNDSFDNEAFERKNASRMKFGLKPMTQAEFLEHEQQVRQLALEQERRAIELTASTK